MADIEEDIDPYAVSSDSDEEESNKKKKPPPKIDIGASADLKRIKEALTNEENKSAIKDEKTLEEIAELRRTKGEEMSKMKKDFESGTVVNDPEAAEHASTAVVTGLDKQTLSAFKDKFEKMDNTLEQNLEERLRGMEKQLEGVGKENLTSRKGMFEGGEKEFTADQKEELLGLQRSEADRKRVLAAFSQSEKSGGQRDEEEQKNCCICDKIVYPVEKVVASKRVYHSNCFKCAKCAKKLSPTTFNSHQGQLYCRPHMLEVLHPERAGTFGAVDGDEEDGQIHDDDDDEYAVTSKPKQLGADVVRAGNANIGDELAALKSSLKEKKESWQSSVAETQSAAGAANRSQQLAEEIEAGKVRANLDKLAAGGEIEVTEDEEKRKQLDAIREQVSEVKNKWKTGDLEKTEASGHEGVSKEELEELKKGPKVRERFSERLQPNDFADENKSYDKSELENSSAAEARKSFLEGLAYQSGPVEKSAASDLQDLKFTGLHSFKDKFEKGAGADDEEGSHEKSALDLSIQLKNIKQALAGADYTEDNSPEARAERKKQEIEAEFLRYKLARKIGQAKKQKGAGEELEEGVDEREHIPSAEVGSIKNRFEAGEAFQSRVGGDKQELDVDVKMAGKAREKFKNIEAQNPQGSAPMPRGKADGTKPSKWDKKGEFTAEVVNKRAVENEESDEEDEEAFDVKNLMNKFKNIENIGPTKIERKLDELEALRVEAKNLRQRFEGASQQDDEQSEEKKRQLEEEFKVLKEEREKARKELEAEQEGEESGQAKEEVQVAADHASKMTAKWEKITKKEAKKAEKSKMPQKADQS